VRVDSAKAQLDRARAQAKRYSEDNVSLQIRASKEKVTQAENKEKELKVTWEANIVAFRSNAITDLILRQSETAYNNAASETQLRRTELALLQQSDIVYKREDAEAQIQNRQADVKTSEADLEQRKKELDVMQKDVAVDYRLETFQRLLEHARMEQERIQEQINERTYIAPISGTLHEFRLEPNQWVPPQAALGWIYDLSEVEFHTQVQQKDLPRVTENQHAKIYLDSMGLLGSKAIDATVQQIGAIAVPTERSSIGEAANLFQDPKTPTVPMALVRLRITNPDDARQIKVGYTGQAKILVGSDSLSRLFFR